MNRLVPGLAMLALLAPAAWAGVIVEMEVIDSGSPGKPSSEVFYAQGEMARMDPHSGGDSADMSMIFKDQTMWFIDNKKKVCQKIDKEGMAELSVQLDEITRQMANLPPEQREMMEQMMKGKVPGMADGPSHRVEAGGLEQVGKYSCTVHTLYADEEKVWEVCAADESVGDDIAEAMTAFRALSQFTDDLQEMLQQGPFANMIQTPYNELDELGGFPVRVRTFNKKGEVVRESTVKDITRREVEESVFAVPAGYKVKDLKDQMNKSR